METLKSILTDLDNKKITKQQAYDLIIILFNTKKSDVLNNSGDFRDTQNYESQDEYYGKK